MCVALSYSMFIRPLETTLHSRCIKHREEDSKIGSPPTNVLLQSL